MTPLPFRYDDGGRAAAGFRGTTGDCGIRAVRDTHDCTRDGTRCVYGWWEPRTP
jgi:hypothetical protein